MPTKTIEKIAARTAIAPRRLLQSDSRLRFMFGPLKLLGKESGW
jgi:hypothetical protein